MQSFLQLCADHLVREYDSSFDKTCIVLPTRRSGLVLQGLLKSKKKEAPHITHVDEFITSASGFDKANPVMLLLELYDILRQVHPSIKLEKFTSWGYILLKDFDQIDRNLVDAEALFKNLGDIKNIERWRLGEDRITPKISEYFQLWENLNITYQQLRERLLDQEQAYAGMMYRHLAENAEELLLKNTEYDNYIFIGFNALSKAEEVIFKKLIDKQKAEIIWDADEYYMKDNTENKAGMFLKKYKKNWGSTNWKFQSNYLLNNEKEVKVITVDNASVQGKVANQLLKNWTIKPDLLDDDFYMPETAVVLADENLLLPVLHSLDEQFLGLNISLSLTLKDSALFNLVDILFEQHQTSIRDRETDSVKYNYRSVIKMLNHPFIRQYEKKHCQTEEMIENLSETRSFILLIINFINKNNLIFLGKDDLLSILDSEIFLEKIQEEEGLVEYCKKAQEKFQPLFEVIFRPWKKTLDAIETFESLGEILYSEENILEAAYFREFQKNLASLKYFVNHRPKFIDIRTFKIFLYQAFRETKFDFDSDKDTTLQLMGIVETRNLDFENVVILSVNETVLPRSKKVNSFIPVDIAKEFDIPTYAEQDAVISYHFYRLLQRSRNISLVYVRPSDTYGGKEKSRFILQLQNDLSKQNNKVKIKELSAKFHFVEEKPDIPLIVEKNDNFIEKMKENFAVGLSPSQINSFVSCSLQYYFSQIAGIGRSVVVEETLGADKLGSIVHEILEEVYRDLTKKNNRVDEKEIQGILPEIPRRVEEKFNLDKYASYVITGQNYIVKQVTAQYIKSFLESQMKEIRENGVPFEILALENKENTEAEKVFSPVIFASLSLVLENENIPLTLRGITDRIDKVKEKVRIIDYKTGKVVKEQLKISQRDLDRLVEDSLADKVRQLWLYKYIVAKRVMESGEFQLGEHTISEKDPISAGIYSLRNLDDGLLELNSKDKDSIFPEKLKEYVEVSEQYLSRIISNMLDKSKPFEKTTNLETCKYGAYKEICGR